MKPDVIVLDDVHTFYGASHILHGMNLRLPEGACMSLMGRNGMGKTTTLKTIMGLVAPKQGSVSIKGRAAAGMAPNAIAKAGIAYVPEGREIFPNLSVRENLLIAARPGPDGRNDWTLDRVLTLFPRLAERLNHWGNHLSGGEQQMLTIGRALMTNPDALLLDEVTEGLAPLIRDEIWSVIEVIKGEGMATLIVDKNVAKLMALADRHLIVVKGEVVFSGDSAELAAAPDMLHQHLGV
jgi:branched-chain amino acid transport system ATP-binding protein